MDGDGEVKYHSFLIRDREEGLTEFAKSIPKIREHINSLPETTTTFKPKRIDDVWTGAISEVGMEFLASWKVPDHISSGKSTGKRFVNPNGIDVQYYSDVTAECRCGFIVGLNRYPKERNMLTVKKEHDDHCKEWWRLEARTKMQRKREVMMKRLTSLGWMSKGIMTRFGLKSSSCGDVARRNGVTMKELRNEYRRIAANTYGKLVREFGVEASRVGEIYGHQPSTLGTKWKEYADYDHMDNDERELKRRDSGEWTWEKVDNVAQLPKWMRDRGSADD